MENRLAVPRVSQREQEEVEKGEKQASTKNLCADGTALPLDCSGEYLNPHM